MIQMLRGKATSLHPPERPKELAQAPVPGYELRDVLELDWGWVA